MTVPLYKTCKGEKYIPSWPVMIPCPSCQQPSGELVKKLLVVANNMEYEKPKAVVEQAAARIEALEKALKKYGKHSKECQAEKYPEAWHCICGLQAALIAKELKCPAR